MLDSSKIKKNISSITFDGKYTTIKFTQQFKPDGQNEVINEETPFTTDLLRHGDFNRAMEMFKSHLILRSFAFVEFKDRLGKDINKEWFDKHLYEDDKRFTEVEIKSFIITTKKDVTRFQLVGTTRSFDEEIVAIKSPPIDIIKKPVGEGYNYPLLDIFAAQVETLLTEAMEFLKYKNGNPQLKLAM